MKRLSDELQIDLGVLREEIKKVKNKPQQVGKSVAKNPVQVEKIAPNSPLQNLVEQLWAYMLKNPELFGKFYQGLKKPYFVGTSCLPLYEIAEEIYNKMNVLDLAELRQKIPLAGEVHLIDIMLMRPEAEIIGKAEVEKEVSNIIARIKEKWRETRGKEIQRAISVAEKAGNKSLVNELMVELQIL